jgi:ATP synthase protein I
LAPIAGAVFVIDTQLGLSLLWGYSVAILPSVCFAWFGFRKFGGARQTGAMVSGLYRAEAFKFFLTAALFAAVFAQVDRVYLPVFFLAFVCGQVGSWLATAQALGRQRH